MSKFLRSFALISAILLLHGCATMPAKQAPVNKKEPWQQRRETLVNLKKWTASGAIAVKQKDKGFTASVNWDQTGDDYVVNMFGPAGAGAIRITGKPDDVTLLTSDNKTFKAKTPEDLMQKQLGWKLPLSHWKYWARGLPVAGMPGEMKFDEFHHLTSLTQQGWHIEYQRYTSQDGVDLPSKMRLTYGDMKIKVVISKWDLG